MFSITIHDDKTIKELQAEFQLHFPLLKIEFYGQEHRLGEATAPDAQLPDHLRVGDIRTRRSSALINIHGRMKVSTLESLLHDELGLNIQVFRLSGDVWLQTTSTDHWTLTEQNKAAEELSRAV